MGLRPRLSVLGTESKAWMAEYSTQPITKFEVEAATARRARF